ncbi:MBL fold metallo-hydrolase [candidate division KSB1 bacterium]|nr:MBL fold metallo-hydrolase [candidate division KSB1 bacterium]
MKFFILSALMLLFSMACFAQYAVDTLKTSLGNLEITFIGHSSLMFTINNLVFHIDPVSREGDYSKLPKADVILVTHEHGDHLDPALIKTLRKEKAELVFTETCQKNCGIPGRVLKNGDSTTLHGVRIEAVPAYNIVHKRQGDIPFHPKGTGNGYVLTFGDKRIYVAGDTENTPEMKSLKNIHAAFLPMNVPFTMDPEMVADAAKAFRPQILYPYHYGGTDTQKLVDLLKGEKDIEVRIRKM